MQTEHDQRASHRIDHPDAVVKYKYKKNSGLFSSYSDSLPILNLSKSGLAIHMSDILSYGRNIELKLRFTDGSSLKLKGLVRWQTQENHYDRYVTGIQFNAFGNQNGYNPTKALDYLRTIDGLGISKTMYDKSDKN